MQATDIARLETQNTALNERLRSLQDSPAPAAEEVHLVRQTDVVVGAVIGHGGWGTVKDGEFLGRKVAVKQPHQEIMHATTVERMKREASSMARVHHPNLVAFLGANFDDGKLPIIVIELMETNLRVTYEKKPLDKHQMIGIFTDVAHALHYLHSLREPLIHRDLSSPNVLLKSLPGSKTYTAKVSDFGSANFVKTAKTIGEGAYIYSAPECFPSKDAAHPKAKQTVKIDSYSYGVLLCEVVNRRLPEDERWGEMVASLGGHHGSGSNSSWKVEGLQELVLRCTKHKPEERLAMRDILNHFKHQVFL